MDRQICDAMCVTVVTLASLLATAPDITTGEKDNSANISASNMTVQVTALHLSAFMGHEDTTRVLLLHPTASAVLLMSDERFASHQGRFSPPARSDPSLNSNTKGQLDISATPLHLACAAAKMGTVALLLHGGITVLRWPSS